MTLLPLSASAAADTVQSPDGRLTLTAGVKGGKPGYSLKRGNETIICNSALGFTLDSGSFCDGFKLLKTTRGSFDETWEQPWGEERVVRNNYNELKLFLQEAKGSKRLMNIVFRVFNDGIGFRYEFPKQPNLKAFKIMDELTEFALPTDAEEITETEYAELYQYIQKNAVHIVEEEEIVE